MDTKQCRKALRTLEDIGLREFIIVEKDGCSSVHCFHDDEIRPVQLPEDIAVQTFGPDYLQLLKAVKSQNRRIKIMAVIVFGILSGIWVNWISDDNRLGVATAIVMPTIIWETERRSSGRSV